VVEDVELLVPNAVAGMLPLICFHVIAFQIIGFLPKPCPK
jgi:hypothetical protein